MASFPLPRALLLRERGRTIVPLRHLIARDWSIHVTPKQRSIPLPSHVTYIRSQGDFLVYLTAAGEAKFLLNCSGPLALSFPSEVAVKVLLSDTEITLITMNPPSTRLSFHRIPLELLRTGALHRTPTLAQVAIQLCELTQVDIRHQKVVAATAEFFSVWDLPTESLVFNSRDSFGVTAWYSHNHVIQCACVGPNCVYSVTDLSAKTVRTVTTSGKASPFIVEVVRGKLVLGLSNSPIVVVDLRQPWKFQVFPGPTKFYLETEVLNDAFVVLSGGSAAFASAPDKLLSLECRSPLFTDGREMVVIFDGDRLIIASYEGKILKSQRVLLPGEVTAVGVNEETLEIYVACGGQLLVLV